MHPPVAAVRPLPKPPNKPRPRGFHLVILGDATRPTRQRYVSRTFIHALVLLGLLLTSTLAALGVAVSYQSHQATARHTEVLSLLDERERLYELLARQEEQFNELALQARSLSDRVAQLEHFAAEMDRIVRANPDVVPDGMRIDLALSAPGRPELPAGGALPMEQLVDWTARTLAAATESVAVQDRRMSALRRSLDDKVYRLQHTPSIWPVEGGWLSSNFGYRNHPVTGQREHHDGIDIAAPLGTPVVATAAGTVVRAGWVQGYGYMVEIDHGFGLRTIYGHAERLLVKRGARVTKGQEILLVGNSGVSTGPHLHYEVRLNGRPVSPWPYLP